MRVEPERRFRVGHRRCHQVNSCASGDGSRGTCSSNISVSTFVSIIRDLSDVTDMDDLCQFYCFVGQPERVCGTRGIVLRVSQSSSCVVTSGITVYLLVAVVVLCVVPVSIVVVNIGVVRLFVWVVLFVVVDAVCGGVFVFCLTVIAVVGVSLVVGRLFLVAVSL